MPKQYYNNNITNTKRTTSLCTAVYKWQLDPGSLVIVVGTFCGHFYA